MAVTHSASLRNTLAEAVRTAIGATTARVGFHVGGTVDAPGPLAAQIVNVTFGAASSGQIATSSDYSDTNATGNASPVTKCSLANSSNTVAVYCDVAASGSDVNMSGGLTINSGDTVTISSGFYYQAPL